MKTKEFLELLETHTNKQLIFEYSPTKWVGANYHITEVKNTMINSVDCGGRADSWKETVVQLWEDPQGVGKKIYLKSQKALAIFKRVDAISPLLLDTEIKFEYGNDQFHTAQLETFGFDIQENKLVIKLHTLDTLCKAKDVCMPQEKEMISENQCNPASGCC